MAKPIQDPALELKDTARRYNGDEMSQLKINTQKQCI